MDIHREVIGTQYYLYGSLHWFPVEFVMNEKMILVNQYLSRLISSKPSSLASLAIRAYMSVHS